MSQHYSTYSDAPPPYTQAGGSSGNDHSTLHVPAATPRQRKERNGISTNARRSMEDEQRPVPKGWVRQFDQESGHQFYVDTTTNPPRSIWHHPYDDERYLSTLSSEERERLQQEHQMPHDGYETTDDEGDHIPASHSGKGAAAGLAGGAAAASGSHSVNPASTTSNEKLSFGRRLKDKLTSSTHEEREAERRQQALAEQRAYEMHQKVRVAMAKAMQTGQPQLVGKDRNGKDVYVEPPTQNAYGGGMYGGGGYGYNPYARGPYSNSMYMRPSVPYGRPYGMGYGGGLGLPLAGGLMGGLMLGGLMGGF